MKILLISGAIAICGLVSGCVESPDQLEAKPNTVKGEKVFSENYQAVYRRLATTAKRCQSGVISANASTQVDAELYNELGFGEVSQRLINWGVNNYYWKAKVERIGPNQTKVVVFSGQTINNKVALNRVLAWASGSTSCTSG